jgi:predicted ArsR family transcriptional regulator
VSESGGRKEAILLLIKARGQATLSEVADHLGVTKQGAIRHVEGLRCDGLLTSTPAEIGRPGRPEHVYTLTEDAATHFPQAHRELAAELVHFMTREQVTTFFRQRAGRLETEYGARLTDLDFADRVRELARLATEHGHMAEVVEDEDAEGNVQLTIRQSNCPIADLAGETGIPCQHEQQMYERLLGAEVDRTSYIPDSATACTYVIRTRR